MELFIGQLGLGLALGLAALGSALGIGAAGRAAAGAWAKEAKAGRQLSFTYIILTGMPLSQTIYAFLLMLIGLKIRMYDPEVLAANAGALFGIGLAVGLAELFSAWMQGLIGASACRSLSESEGEGFVFLVIAMGIVETVGLLSFVFLLFMMPEMPEAAETVNEVVAPAGEAVSMVYHNVSALLC